MKKTLILLLISCFSFFNQGLCQGIDKPQYQVIAHRAGTYLGTFSIELFPLIAPLAVNNFDSLVNVQFFDSTAFHRVVPGFVIQGGDPNSIHGPISTWGQGNANQPNVPAEFSAVRHLRGILGAARDVDTNSANSQFYICVAPATFLDGQYTVYGQVTSGMEVVDTIVSSPRDANDVPLQKIEMFVSYMGANNSIPAAPSLLNPANLTNGVLNTQQFQWSGVQDAVLYKIELSTDSNFTTITNWRSVGTNLTTMPGLLPSTVYYWRVTANNGGHESQYSITYTFTTATAAPLLHAPPNVATNVFTNPVFQWSNVPNATDYNLQVSTSSIFTTGSFVFNQSGITDTMQQVSGLNTNTLYYWRVRGINNGALGSYSSKFSFTTGTSVGLNDEAENKDLLSITNLSPNPGHHHITVSFTCKAGQVLRFLIVNSEGKTVKAFQQKASDQKNTKRIDVRQLNKGYYVLKISDGIKEISRKIEIN